MNKARKFLPFLIILIGLQLDLMAIDRTAEHIARRQAKKELDPPYNIYNEIEARYFERGLQIDERKDFLDQLVIAKSLLIDGHTDDAILVLNRQALKTKNYSKLLLINRFLALAYFADTDPKKSSEILQSLSNNASWYYQNCALRIVSAMSMPEEKKDDIEEIFQGCMNHSRLIGSYKNETWLRLVLEHKLNGYVRSTKIRDYFLTNNMDDIEAVLKYGLYFSRHKQILKYYETIPVEFYADATIRTLVAANLYNNGQHEQALKLAGAINNSNTNKLKGFEEVKKENYKTAYSHFISNLLSKPYSIANNKLILASAWLSRNYKNARVALSKIPVSEGNSSEKELLKINLLLKENKNKEARYLMDNLDIKYNRKLPYEAAILSSYIKLINDDPQWVRLSDKSCLNKNVISCWMHLQSKIWQNFSKDILASERKMESKDIQDRLNSMISKVDIEDKKEPVLIYQKDVYELDLKSYPNLGKEYR